MQNAIDAASLAAAQDLPDITKAAATADKYIALNGYKASNITVSFSEQNTVITIVGNKKVDYTFARILGLSSFTVAPRCAATVEKSGAFDYAVFSGSDTIELPFGNKYYIQGSVHTNYNFKANGATLTITGVCEAVGTISGVNGSIVQRPGASYMDMPDFSEMIKQQAESAGQVFYGDKTYDGGTIDATHPIYVNGNLTINSSKFQGVGFIFATGNITFNGSSVKVSTDNDAVCIYSKTGDIRLNGSGAEISGILYAPNGCVRMNGADQVVNGRIISKTVDLNGAKATVISGTNDLNCIPATYIRLIN